MGNHDYIRRILAKAQFTGNFQDAYPTAQIHALIDTVPAEDVQCVIYCKDCKHYKLSEYNTVGIHVCKKRGGVVGDHDFCSRAEKADKED